jgi:hypothetical protein
VVGIRLESNADSHLFRLVGGALVLGIVAAYVAVNFYRDSVMRPHAAYMAKDRAYLSLTAKDDYDAVVRKLGMPRDDHWQGPAAGTRFRALAYPDRAYTVVLMAPAGKDATYIGALDPNWRPLHSDGDAGLLLRNLPRF